MLEYMPKRKDENETAFDTLQEILRRDTERDGKPVKPKPDPEKVNYRLVAGRKGGLIGGKLRAQKLSAKRRKAIARLGAKARWAKAKKKP